MSAEYINMLVPCELLGGHKIEKIEGTSMNNTKTSIPWCIKCKRIVNLNHVDIKVESIEKARQESP